MPHTAVSKGKVDLTIGNGQRYLIAAAIVIALLSLLDLNGVSLENVQSLVATVSVQLADTITHLVQARPLPGRSALTVVVALLLAALGFFYFLYSIPAKLMRSKYLQQRRGWNYLGLLIGCGFLQALCAILLHFPALREFSARPDGKLTRTVVWIIQTDTGLGVTLVFLLTLTAYLYATLIKTAYANLTSSKDRDDNC
ncbi:hypothetical protein [Pseudomonas nitroreducens]|uniref:hypothetical protein n=1 Tax=Pseudomonas nitroreducens TaxID=46680 RepID=UPI00265A850B|nr:hypothetical protein [Pseudomonas nitroreducens]MCP1649107.1 hypothetical protein [Pseudomonas nitroreducens]MCP1684932.1 hypothetical protein [Pseudomonas nitroreducens]